MTDGLPFVNHLAVSKITGDSMLVLSRKVNESIVIDGGIEIMVVEIRGDRVRLGIAAVGEQAEGGSNAGN